MRSLLRVLLLLLISFTVVTAMLKSGANVSKTKPEPKILADSGTDEEDDETASVSVEEEEQSEEWSAEYFSIDKNDIKKAWNSAIKLANRNPAIWRKDKNNNVILSRDYTISSPLAFRALVKPDERGANFEAVQEEYYGADDEDNFANALKYKAKDQDQDDFLSLIEIALNGNVSDDRGEYYCWVPSLIHQDLFLRHDSARRWHSNLFSKDFKYGMAGHNLAFQHMGIGLKDVRHISERVLDTLDQVHDLMYIHNYQDQCSDVVSQITYIEDPVKRAENLKNNWGLPRVAEFIDPKAQEVKQAVVAKPKKLTTVTAAVQATTKKVSNKPVLDDQNWPSLSMSSSEKSGKQQSGSNAVTKKKKTTSIEI